MAWEVPTVYCRGSRSGFPRVSFGILCLGPMLLLFDGLLWVVVAVKGKTVGACESSGGTPGFDRVVQRP